MGKKIRQNGPFNYIFIINSIFPIPSLKIFFFGGGGLKFAFLFSAF